MRIAAGHPALPGHFPGHPVVPGVVLLDKVIESLSRHVGGPVRALGFPAVKFLAPLQPEQEFDVTFSTGRSGQAGFEVSRGDTRLAKGTVSFEVAA